MPREDARIRMDVNLTLLSVTVLDESSGEIVNGLRREPFTVIEDKAPQPIVAFSSDDTLCSAGSCSIRAAAWSTGSTRPGSRWLISLRS